MNNRSELEIFLYKIIEEISKINAPIVFKGGLALKELLNSNNSQNNIDRKTVDIDANWTGKVDYDEITRVLETAIKNVDNKCTIKLTRMPKEKTSMGYTIFDNNDHVISKIDLDIKNNPFYVIYEINNVNIKYSSLEKILADKLSVLSSSYIFRRTKDLLDVYLIIKDNDIKFEKIKEILEYDSRELGDFKVMLNNKKMLEEAYNKLFKITNKPEFIEVWNKIVSYLLDNSLISEKDLVD